MSTEYKEKSTIPNLYDILGISQDVCKDINCNKLIQKAYIKRAKTCHPDKHPGKKEVEEIFQLITMAYDILRDEKERNMYNNKLSLEKQSLNDYFNLKDNTTNYMKTIGDYVEPNDQQKLTFKEQMRTINNKHGYDPLHVTAIPSDDVKIKVSELNKLRTLQDHDLKPEQIFESNRFDAKKFNAAFDKVHTQKDSSMALYNGAPVEWNAVETNNAYGSFNDINNLYAEDGNIDFTFNESNKKITKKDMDDIAGADYYDAHNVIDDNYYQEMKHSLRNRDSEAVIFDNMKYNDYKKDEFMGYGIFDKLGFKFDNRIELDKYIDDDSFSKKYEKLMQEREQKLSNNYIEDDNLSKKYDKLMQDKEKHLPNKSKRTNVKKN